MLCEYFFYQISDHVIFYSFSYEEAFNIFTINSIFFLTLLIAIPILLNLKFLQKSFSLEF